MSWMFSFSKHAKEKMRERGIGLEDLRKAFENPMFRFYDVVSRAEVIIGESTLYNLKIFLVAIFRRKNNRPHITVYPVKNVEDSNIGGRRIEGKLRRRGRYPLHNY